VGGITKLEFQRFSPELIARRVLALTMTPENQLQPMSIVLNGSLYWFSCIFDADGSDI